MDEGQASEPPSDSAGDPIGPGFRIASPNVLYSWGISVAAKENTQSFALSPVLGKHWAGRPRRML